VTRLWPSRRRPGIRASLWLQPRTRRPTARARPRPAPPPDAPDRSADGAGGAAEGSSRYRIEIADLALRDSAVVWEDAAILPAMPPTELRFDEVRVSDLRLPSRADRDATFHLEASVADAVQRIAVEGSVRLPATGSLVADADLRMDGIDGARIAGYLAAIGLVPSGDVGNLHVDVGVETRPLPRGGTRLGAEIRAFEIGSGENLLTFERTSIDGLVLTRGGGLVGDDLAIGRLDVFVRRTLDGDLQLPLVTIPARPPERAPSSSAPATTSAAPPAASDDTTERRPTGLPRVVLGSVRVGPWSLEVLDEKTGRSVRSTLEATVDGLRLGPAAEGHAPGRIELRVRAPGRVEELELTGTCGGKDRLKLDVALRADGIDPHGATDLAGLTGVRPLDDASDGTFRAAMSAEFEPTTDGSDVAFTMNDCALAFGDATPLALGAVQAPSIRVGTRRGTDLGTVLVQGLDLRLDRDADGRLRLGPLLLGADAAGSARTGTDTTEAEDGGDEDAGAEGARDGAAPAAGDPAVAQAASGAPQTPEQTQPQTPQQPRPDAVAADQQASTAPTAPILPAGLLWDRIELRGIALTWTDGAATADEPAASEPSTAEAAGDAAQAGGDANADASTDETAPAPPFRTRVSLDVVLPTYRPTADADVSLPFEATLTASNVFDTLSLTGSVSETRGAGELTAGLDLELDGVRTGELLSAYASDSQSLVERGRLSTHLDLSFARLTDELGGQRLRAAVRDLAWVETEGERSGPWLEIDRIELAVERLLDERIDVEAVRVTGVRGRAERTRDGGWAIATGVAPRPASARPVDTAPPSVPMAGGGNAPERRILLGADRRSQLTDLVVRELDVHVESFDFVDPFANPLPSKEDDATDETSPAIVPIKIEFRLRSTAPLVLLDPDADTPPRLQLALSGSAIPLVESLDLELDLSPLDASPRFEAKLAVSGIHGDALARTLPDLARTIDASRISNGTLGGRLSGILEARRLGPLDFALRDGFGLEVEINDLALRPEPDGEALAGIDNVLLDVERIAPNPLGGTDVVVTSLEANTPRLLAERSAAGLSVAGIVFRAAPPADGEAGAEGDAEGAKTAPAAPAADGQNGTKTTDGQAAASGVANNAANGAQTPDDDRGAEPPRDGLRIDEFSIQGLDVRYVDTTRDPSTIVPLTDLELSVRDFASGRALAGMDDPLQIEIYLRAGEVPLPERLPESKLFGVDSLLSAAVQAVAGSGEIEMQERPLFGEISIRGSLAPTAEGGRVGTIRTTVSGLEMTGLRGLAAEGGVQIGDGLLDLDLTTRLQPSATQISSVARFSRLSMSEPAGGPISTYLRLPAPLDTVLYVLRDSSGEQRIPLDVTIDNKGVSTSRILGAVTSALGAVIRDAVAGAPLRVASPVTDLLQLTGGKTEDLTLLDRPLAFPVGSTILDAEARSALLPLAKKVAEDPQLVLIASHALSAADRALVFRRANPSTSDCRALVRRLRTRNTEIESEREAIAVRARAAFAIGEVAVARELEESLRVLDRERTENEDALDRLLALLQPGAERRADARTRQAVRELAEARLEALRTAIRETLGGLPAQRALARLETRRPRGTVVVEIEDGEGGRIELSVRRRRD
jgi:hypothetical protein